MAIDLLHAWRPAPLAEVAWLDRQGRPQLSLVVPLLRKGAPAMALTYDRQDEAAGIADSPHSVLGVLGLSPGDRVSQVATLSLEPDPDGERFQAELLAQELAKHPPSRRRAESMLLRSEHWWYLPRLLLTGRLRDSPRRHKPGDAVAAVATGDGLALTTCVLTGDTPDHVDLPDGPTVVLQHGATLPDLEERWERRWHGRLVGGAFEVERMEGEPPRQRPRSLWQRWRDEARFEKACRRALAGASGR